MRERDRESAVGSVLFCASCCTQVLVVLVCAERHVLGTRFVMLLLGVPIVCPYHLLILWRVLGPRASVRAREAEACLSPAAGL